MSPLLYNAELAKGRLFYNKGPSNAEPLVSMKQKSEGKSMHSSLSHLK
jgi:hypothetical protein